MGQIMAATDQPTVSERDDEILIYGFAWRDPPPDPVTFERFMHEAVRAIDALITQGL
jgi:hypothetical protein